MSPLFTAGVEDVRCPICSAAYKCRNSLLKHMKKHEGQTRCPICQQELSMVGNLRRHMVTKHSMSKQEVDRLTNKRLNTTEYEALFSQEQLP